VKKGQNGRKSLRRKKPTVGCNASRRKRRRYIYMYVYIYKKKLRGLSPRANYIDRAAAAGRRS